MNKDIKNAMREIINCAEILQGDLLDIPGVDAIAVAKKYAAIIQASAERILSLPMRNCDKFRTAQEAKDAYGCYVFTVPPLHPSILTESSWPSFVDWLFAPVMKEEKE